MLTVGNVSCGYSSPGGVNASSVVIHSLTSGMVASVSNMLFELKLYKIMFFPLLIRFIMTIYGKYNTIK